MSAIMSQCRREMSGCKRGFASPFPFGPTVDRMRFLPILLPLTQAQRNPPSRWVADDEISISLGENSGGWPHVFAAAFGGGVAEVFAGFLGEGFDLFDDVGMLFAEVLLFGGVGVEIE